MAVAASMLFVGKANAQLNVHLGYSPVTYTTTYNGNDEKMDLNGFFLGANYNINLTGDLNVGVGADFRYNTKSDTRKAGTLSIDVDHSQIVLDVPVLFNYGLSLSDALRVSAFAGPNFSFALSGKSTYDANATVLSALGLSADGEFDWYGEDSDQKKFDIGLTFGLSLGYREFNLFGGYNMGLLNLSDSDNTTLKSANWFIGLGYAL